MKRVREYHGCGEEYDVKKGKGEGCWEEYQEGMDTEFWGRKSRLKENGDGEEYQVVGNFTHNCESHSIIPNYRRA